ncbi:nucleoside phosphatase family-domain-containing protein [Dendryphion nanum]|uniref:guanosine-diphosphatase n=1 Tax=Dendryphion nanum TaxID=256645 RepID=A0A9P9IBV7_9PLEO|nr:nucleoside phosphatase family-domain-containing protein [Dendryphion nanum]
MSSGVDVRRRPGIWSYFSFNSGPRRRTSVSLPRNSNDSHHNDDPFEKPDRHSRHRATNSAAFMTDYKNGAMNQGQRLRYLKTGGIIAFILLILYFVAPRNSLTRGSAPAPGNGQTAAPGAEVKTCTKSYSKDVPLIQYALIVDAGSTGSRIHVYKYNNCESTPELEDEVFKQTTPKKGGSGLSSYGEDAQGAAESLDVLLDVAMEKVPDEYKRCTPITVKATAGLRKLGKENSDKILAAVRTRLETKYPFPVVAADKGGVEVMDGKYEGVYAWITTNYLLGKLSKPDKTPTVAVLDLGGGSTQIVFEPTFKGVAHGGMPEKLQEGDHKYDLDFGGRHFELYQHSYLGYGLMEARNNMHVAVVDSIYKEKKDSEDPKAFLSAPIVNPCIAPKLSIEVDVALPPQHPLGASVSVKMIGPTTASPAHCRAFAEKTLEKDAACKISPCAFRGVHQPSFEQTFAREQIYLLSYFYDRTSELGMPESFSIAELKALADKVCHGEEAWDVFSSVTGAVEELKKRPEYCLDLNFQIALLHTGYEMPIDREVKIAKKIKGNELGWCLGASLPLLKKESGWECKVKEIS